MKAIVVLFDSLNRGMLPAYGCDWVHAPNFERLADRAVTFDNCYAGSMACMPARRELHTGRYNFLHRNWGPLEPFDDSVPEMLTQQGVYTYFVSDHPQYWWDDGTSYHQRFSAYEFVRGQHDDFWKPHVGDAGLPARPDYLGRLTRQDWVNRQYMTEEADHPQTRVFDAGAEFIRTNKDDDRWLLFLDVFDPHEPFFTPERYKHAYPDDYAGPFFDWPRYKRLTEPQAAVEHVRLEYAALVTMCDASLGRVLDLMDEHALWDDTMLIVCTDHGFLLGEHDWLGKGLLPWYDELIHTPLFVWDPRTHASGERRQSLVQTIDIAPTLLEFFGLERTQDMLGVPLAGTIASDSSVREAGLFGEFGSHVCVTDSRYVYMRASADVSNQPLYKYTLMPTRADGDTPIAALRDAELAPPFTFTKGLHTLRVEGFGWCNPWHFGSLLFDLETDPEQERPLVDDDLELHMAQLLVDLMRASDAPAEQYERLGLPAEGKVTRDHLLVRVQSPQVEASRQPVPTAADFPAEATFALTTPLRELIREPATADVLRRHVPTSLLEASWVADASLIELASFGIWWTMLQRPTLQAIVDDLADVAPSATLPSVTAESTST